MTTQQIQHIPDFEEHEKQYAEDYLFSNLQFQKSSTTNNESTSSSTTSTTTTFDYEENYMTIPIDHWSSCTTMKHTSIQLFYRQYKCKPISSSSSSSSSSNDSNTTLVESPKAIIFLFHGAGSLSEFIAPLANHLMTQNQYHIYIMDQLCHGKSRYIDHHKKQQHNNNNNNNNNSSSSNSSDVTPPPDCLVRDYRHFDQCIIYFMNQILKLESSSQSSTVSTQPPQLPPPPVFLWGESMGGATVLSTLLHHNLMHHSNTHNTDNTSNTDNTHNTDNTDNEMLKNRIKGMIVSAPAITIPNKPNTLVIGALRLMNRIAPQMKPLPHDPFTHSRIRRFAQYYDEHASTVAPLPLALMTQILDMSLYLDKHLKLVNMPMLLMHGQQDTTVDIQGSYKLWESNSHVDKEFLVYEESYHALINEYTTWHAVNKIAQWIQARLQ